MKTRLLLLLLVISGYAFAQVPSDFIMKYSFTNGSLVNENTATTNGNFTQTGSTAVITSDRLANANAALTLNQDYFETSQLVNETANIPEMTISFWINPSNSASTTVNEILRVRSAIAGREFVISENKPQNQISFRATGRNTSTNAQLACNFDFTQASLFDGNWHHILYKASLFNPQNVTFQLYVDGVLKTDTSSYGCGLNNISNGVSPTFLSRPRMSLSSLSTAKYEHQIDDIYFYKRALTTTEISALATLPELVNIPDANFKAALVANTAINTNGDTEIQFSEALTYTGTISVANLNISSLIGVEAFKNITNIDASNNNLDTANFEVNTALTSINVSNNQLTSLSIKNGNNTNVTFFSALNNPNLFCISVDNEAYSTANFTNIDAQSTFSEICLISVYVDQSAAGMNNGSSWSNAYTSLKTALNTTPTGQFWVKAGTYNPGANRNDSFTLGANQEIYGGFNGTETNLSQRNPRVNVTILSGDFSANDAGTFNPSDANRSENNYRIITVNGTDVVIDGFEITSANANGSGAVLQEGSGVNISGAYHVTINNCKFTKHTLNRAGIIRAIDNSGNYNITVNHTIFKDNQSSFATCYYGRSSGGVINLKFENSLFTNNTATTNSAASAIWLRQDASGSQNLDIVNTTFSNNTLNSATPVISYLGSVPSVNIYNSIFWNNTNGSGTNVDAIQAGTTGAKSNNISNNGFSAYSSASNISTSDPQFVGPTNFRLTSASPGKDLGDNNFIPAGITKDLDGNDRVFNSTVDIGAYEFNPALSVSNFVKNNSFKIYPNPVTETLNISTEKDIKSVVVYTVLGSKVLTAKGNTINVSALEHGVYMIKITDTSNQQITKRFIKQ